MVFTFSDVLVRSPQSYVTIANLIALTGSPLTRCTISGRSKKLKSCAKITFIGSNTVNVNMHVDIVPR